jgi:hypothetical protein
MTHPSGQHPDEDELRKQRMREANTASKRRQRGRDNFVADEEDVPEEFALQATARGLQTPQAAKKRRDRETQRHAENRKKAKSEAQQAQAGPSRTRRDSAGRPVDTARAGTSETQPLRSSRRQDWRKHAKRLREEEERLGSRMVSALLGVSSPEPEYAEQVTALEREQRIAEVRLKREREQLLRGQQGPGHDGGRGL